MRGSRALVLSLAVVVLLATAGFTSGRPAPAAASPVANGDERGTPWRGAPGKTETVDQIQARERARRVAPQDFFKHTEPASEGRGPDKSPRAGSSNAPAARSTAGPKLAVTTNFLGVQVSDTPGYFPPDTQGAVGPTQILVTVNGRIRVFDKFGVVGALNADMDTFFASVLPLGSQGTSDPHVQYDRLSSRWFVVIISVDTPNRVLIAMSSGPTITGSSSFTFFQFQHDLVGTVPNADTGQFADYPTLGVDRFALYIGMNIFNASGTSFLGTTGFVVRKADLIASTLTVTAFRQLATSSGAGPFTPQGVQNADPAATEGYFIGVDNVAFSKLDVRRVTNPGGTPTISANIQLSVPTTVFPMAGVPQQGSPTKLDELDDRLFAATIERNKITGALTLWTAHNIQVNTSGVASNSGGRDGSRWYEIANLTTTPTVVQSGTLFDPAASSPRSFWIPSIAANGQGNAVLGSSVSSAVQFAGTSFASRLRTDSLGALGAFTSFQGGTSTYNPADSSVPHRWGDYSATAVDPADDQTFWTFQEYPNGTSSWAVRVARVLAPPPAAPASASGSVAAGQASANVTITGTSSAGSEFFDPGADVGGPGFANHLTASVTGGVVVNSAMFTDPTHVTLNLNTTAATAGPQSVTITNPDGQSATGAGILTVTAAGGCTITGTAGNDVLNGTAGPDVICGLGGNDIINGLGGDDTLQGGDGNDDLTGGTGNDTLDGGTGSDTIYFNDSGVNAGMTIDLGQPASGPSAVLGTDTFVYVSGVNTIENVRATPFNDVINGSAAANTLIGLGGNDTIHGGNGADTIYGGQANDSLFGDTGADTILPGLGDDPTVDGGKGFNTLEYRDLGGSAGMAGQHVSLPNGGTSVTSGPGGADTITSTFSNLNGSPRNDVLTAARNGIASTVNGLGGNDTLSVLDGDGIDHLTDTSGANTCTSFDAGDVVGCT